MPQFKAKVDDERDASRDHLGAGSNAPDMGDGSFGDILKAYLTSFGFLPCSVASLYLLTHH